MIMGLRRPSGASCPSDCLADCRGSTRVSKDSCRCQLLTLCLSQGLRWGCIYIAAFIITRVKCRSSSNFSISCGEGGVRGLSTIRLLPSASPALRFPVSLRRPGGFRSGCLKGQQASGMYFMAFGIQECDLTRPQSVFRPAAATAQRSSLDPVCFTCGASSQSLISITHGRALRMAVAIWLPVSREVCHWQVYQRVGEEKS